MHRQLTFAVAVAVVVAVLNTTTALAFISKPPPTGDVLRAATSTPSVQLSVSRPWSGTGRVAPFVTDFGWTFGWGGDCRRTPTTECWPPFNLRWGGLGSDPGRFSRPTGVAARTPEVSAVDAFTHFSNTQFTYTSIRLPLSFHDGWGPLHAFSFPHGMRVEAGDNVFIANRSGPPMAGGGVSGIGGNGI
jgi:hypothetical protein